MAGQARASLEFRPFKIEQGILSNHDGSAIFSHGNVMALASISGPSEVRIRDELTNQSTLDIHFTPLQGIPGIASTSFSSSLKDVYSLAILLHLHPRSLTQINLQTYSSPPIYIPQPLLKANQKPRQPQISPPHPDTPIPVSLQSAHINAITCACLDGSIHMKYMIVAASAVIIRRGIRKNYMKGWRAGETMPIDEENLLNVESAEFEILLDPSPYEESLSKSQHVFAFAFTRDINKESLDSTLVYNESRGSCSSKDYLDVLKLCREATKTILEAIRTNYSRNL